MFVDRLLATLVHPRHGVTHDVLACWFGVDRSTITRAVGEVRPLLAEAPAPRAPPARAPRGWARVPPCDGPPGRAARGGRRL
ncbi:transposase family protein [Streptomyces nigra]|uniref:helix-turn-helix domain-containing protein n=1 Tax=Streptomyces nigra TaxID=1827580 RepID=UPI0036852EC5